MTSMSAGTSDRPGTAATRSLADSAGSTPPAAVRVMAIVPPIPSTVTLATFCSADNGCLPIAGGVGSPVLSCTLRTC